MLRPANATKPHFAYCRACGEAVPVRVVRDHGPFSAPYVILEVEYGSHPPGKPPSRCPGSYGFHYVVTRHAGEKPDAPCPACGLRLIVSRYSDQGDGCSCVVFPDHDHGVAPDGGLHGSPVPPDLQPPAEK